MAQIIDFRSIRHARPARNADVAGGAEILFFLGVRYERMTDMPDTPAPAEGPARGAKRGRKRRA